LRHDLKSPDGFAAIGRFFEQAKDEAAVNKARRRKRSRAMVRRILSAPVSRC